MIKLEFAAAGRPANLTTTEAQKTIKELLQYFSENKYHSELIRAANTTFPAPKNILWKLNCQKNATMTIAKTTSKK